MYLDKRNSFHIKKKKKNFAFKVVCIDKEDSQRFQLCLLKLAVCFGSVLLAVSSGWLIVGV